MSLTFPQIVTLGGEIASVQAQVLQVIAACNSLKTAGTTLYNDALLLTQFPTDGPAARTWMLSTNTALTTLLGALSQMPSLNS